MMLRRKRVAVIGLLLVCYCIVHVLKQRAASVTYVQNNQPGLNQLQNCFERILRGTVDNECDSLLHYIKDQDPRGWDSHNATYNTMETPFTQQYIKNNTMIPDCYNDLGIFSNKTAPFPNFTDLRLNYLDSFRRCGHPPTLLSHTVERPDNLSLPVPNVVHYIWFHSPWNIKPMEFMHYMAVMSANKYMKPQYILWHGNHRPRGPFWQCLLKEIPNLYYVPWQPPQHLNNKTLIYPQYKSDIVRMWILLVHGGIYLDLDVIVLKSFDPLRRLSFVEGRELRFTLANGIVLTAPMSIFLRMALHGYEFHFTRPAIIDVLGSMIIPNALAHIFPQFIHIEERSLIYPTWPHIRKLYVEQFDWSQNYCLHVFGEAKWHDYIPANVTHMDQINSTLTTILRHVYYDKVP